MKNFRSCPDWKFSFGKKTYIMGENGSGKTHILDAIHLLSGSSLVYADAHIESWTFFEGIFEKETLWKKYSFFHDEKRAYHNIQWEKVTKPKYLRAIPFRTVFVSPFDMNLLYFAPNIRREYIDNILERSHEQFSKVRRNYDTVMRQRNTLLKKIREWEAEREDLDFWDKKFAECADIYLLYRKKYVSFIEDNLPTIQSSLQKYTLSFKYESTIEQKETIEKTPEDSKNSYQSLVNRYLQENRERDIQSGHTHIGPHRDDFSFFVETNHWEINAAQYLSRGEMKMLLLSLKTLEVKFLWNCIDVPIILLVDDIFAELDEVNITRFLDSLTTYQTILTSQKPPPDRDNWSDFICINLKDI